jgi:hypothetical protein
VAGERVEPDLDRGADKLASGRLDQLGRQDPSYELQGYAPPPAAG